MTPPHRNDKRSLAVGIVAFLAGLSVTLGQDDQDVREQIVESQPAVMWQKEGLVSFQLKQTPERPVQRLPQPLNIGDSASTSNSSRALLFMSDRSPLRLRELTRLQLQPRPGRTNLTRLFVSAGQIYYVNRGQGIRIVPFETPNGAGTAKGTEFVLSVAPDGSRTDITMFEGEVELTNALGRIDVPPGRQGVIEAGQPPRLLAKIEAKNLVQWWVYYPGILAPDELEFTPAEQTLLAASLQAYRNGALPDALQQYPGYPTPPAPGTEAGRIYYAALLLSVGAVDRAEALLQQVNPDAPLVRALRTMIKAVTLDWGARLGDQTQPTGGAETGFAAAASRTTSPLTASELLAHSYAHQATNNLQAALVSARTAVEKSPDFAFGWARVAELEFSHGHTRMAKRAVERAIALAPRNAQAHALNGFLLAADHQLHAAIAAFELAIDIDPALGNAWLGRGLCKRRLSLEVFSLPGSDEWQKDLQAAAILEPGRSLTRSYAGKAFAEVGDSRLAHKELNHAKTLDPNDPTPWLYSALLNREENRINAAVDDLEKSVARNDNRAVYRSRLLLDEDRAVRSANLAEVYQSAGMTDVAVREAARAVTYDYGNYSSHLFLSESYNQLRDPTRFNLRYETVWFNELLLANLLSPVGGTPLSQNISQQEYASLLERDRIGLSSSTEYRSDGQVRQLASQFGNVGNLGWALDLDYQHNEGVRPNNELERLEWYSTLKYQLTPQDSVLLLLKYQDYHSGDNFQYYDWKAVPTNGGAARPDFTWDETQTPLLLGGYHHEWSPGVHSLFLAGRLENDQIFSDRGAAQALVLRNTGLSTTPPVREIDYDALDVRLRSQLVIYTAEMQQILENQHHALVLGGRWQGGEFDTRNRLTNPTVYTNEFPMPPADTHTIEDFQRLSFYGYETLKLPGGVRLTGGLAYEHLTFPENFRSPPIQSGQETRERFDPKAAIVWEAGPETTVRGVYARSLGGVSLDESFRLEPTQLAGFSQAFRTLIPESLVGSVSAPDLEVWGAALDLKPRARTYLGLQGQFLRSDVHQTVGVFDFFYNEPIPYILPSSVRQRLNYEERSVKLTVNQLLSDEWAIGAQYAFVRSELETRYPSLSQVMPPVDSVNRAELQQLNLSLLYQHSSGFFAEAQSLGYFQKNLGSDENLANDCVLQLNLFAGYRFPRRRGDITLGVLNVTDQDYRLNPVTPYVELPRETVFYARLRFRF